MSNQKGIGGGTERYADYSNSNNGQTAFSNNWIDGAKYQQLRGSGSRSNQGFNDLFDSSKGGGDTGTVADDGGGWKLIKQDSGDKTNERKLEYRDVALQWQAAGYDVRVQDHNPDFEGGTGEIAVRVSQGPSETKEPFEPVGKTDDHKTAEENYDKHFEDGNPWDTTNAVDSYQSAFDRATAAGQDMTAGDYLRQRADDKKGGVNRFTNYLTDHNTLASHESHRSAMNAIKKAGHVGLEPPALIDPGDLYNKYKGDIDSIGD